MPHPEFPKIIDSTWRKDLSSCGMKFNYSAIQRLKPKGISIHLHFGGCFAKGVEVFRKSYYGKAHLSVEGALIAGVEAIIRMWGTDVEIAPEKGNKSLASCIDCLYSFVEQYDPAVDPVQPLMIDGEPAVEFNFAFPIPDIVHPTTGEPLLYTGRFDMLASYQSSCFVDDEKSAGQLGDSWQTQWEMASQITGYLHAARLYGYNAQGAIIRGVCPLKNDVKHLFIVQTRSQWEVDRWMHQLQRDLRRAITSWESGDWDYSLDSACAGYGGCPYMTLCKAKEPEKWVDTYYEENTWNPLEKADD